MYKTELIKAMVKKAEGHNVPLTDKQTRAALSALLESVTDALKSGEKVVLPGFGMFGVRMQPAREGRNLFTGERIMIPERKVPASRQAKSSRMRWQRISKATSTGAAAYLFRALPRRFFLALW